MKKTLLSLGLAAATFGVFAQTNSISSGNQPTDSKKGYAFEYKKTTGPSVGTSVAINCLDDAGIHKEGFNADVTFSYDDSEGVAVYTYAGGAKTGGSITLLTDGNCLNLTEYRGTSKSGIDVSEADSVQIEFNASEEVNVAVYAQYASGPASGLQATESGKVDNGGTIEEVAFQTVAAGRSTVMFPLPTHADNETALASDPNTYGLWSFILYVRDASNSANATSGSVDIGIDAIRVGDAIQEETGLEDNAAAVNFNAYPNPASEVINFSSDINGTIELSNTLGSLVASTEGISINVSELPSGIYFATLKVNGVAKAVQRVQVQ
jgi:hypothetical protein